MNRHHRRLIGVGLAGALLVALLPANVAGAAVIDPDDITACQGAEGLIAFNDPLGLFSDTIECMAAFGITVGDRDGNFRTSDDVTRGQMALFLARMVSQARFGNITSIPATGAIDAFDDIADSFARDAINWLADLGIATGVSGGASFAPARSVSREQMASFIVRLHGELGVILPAPSPGSAFTDTASISSAHRDPVLTLHAAGVVQGRADGSYGPTVPITRGQMSAFVVRSIHLIDVAGQWNGAFVVDRPSTSFTVLSPLLVGLPAANVADPREDLLATENLLALSDGDAVSVFQFSVPEDTFLVEGTPATPALFLAALEIGATLVVTPDGAGFIHDLTPAPEVVLEGTIGTALTSIVDAPSGVTLQSFWWWWPGQTYTVDGVAVSEDAFRDHLSPGDTIVIEVLFEDPVNFADSVFRFDLTNGTLSGQVVDVIVPALFAVDVVADDDGVFNRGMDLTLFEIPGYLIVDNPGSSGDPDAIELDFDGALSLPADIGAVVSSVGFVVGGEVTYAREASTDACCDGDVSIVYISDTAPVATTGYVAPQAGAVTPAGEIAMVPGSGFAGDAIDAAGGLVTSVQVDGTLVAPSDLASLLSAGDRVVLSLPFGATDGPLTITSMDLAGDLVAFDAMLRTMVVEVVPGQVSSAFSYTAAPFGYPGTVQYTVGATLVNLAAFDTAIVGAPPGSDIAVVVADTGTVTQFQVTIN